MPCYLVIDGKKQEMDEDIFDQMVQALQQVELNNPPIPEKPNTGIDPTEHMTTPL